MKCQLEEEQWEALAAFIKSEAEYAANENFNRNGCAEANRRAETEFEAKILFVPGYLP